MDGLRPGHPFRAKSLTNNHLPKYHGRPHPVPAGRSGNRQGVDVDAGWYEIAWLPPFHAPRKPSRPLHIPGTATGEGIGSAMIRSRNAGKSRKKLVRLLMLRYYK
jgi:hypothetical protein